MRVWEMLSNPDLLKRSLVDKLDKYENSFILGNTEKNSITEDFGLCFNKNIYLSAIYICCPPPHTVVWIWEFCSWETQSPERKG